MARNTFRRRRRVEPGPRKGRILLVSIMLACGFIALIGRAWWLQVHSNDEYMQRSEANYRTKTTLRAARGSIYDRNGRELALTAMVPSIYGVPRVLREPATVARQLDPLLQTDLATLQRRLSSGKAFVWLQRRVAPSVAKQIEALKIEGIALRDEPRRFYPNRSVGGPIIGFAGIDGVGLEGIERDYDTFLRGKSYTVDALRDNAGRTAMPGGALPVEQLSGYSVVLTLDTRIQQIAEQVLLAQVKAMRAKAGTVVVMDPHTGDILAMAQTPPFDPNLFNKSDPADWRNRAITDVLEPGSTIKPLLIAAAIDLKKISPTQMWDGKHGRIKVGRKTITDVHAVKEMSTLEIIQRSSNVGAVQVGQRIGKQAFHNYLRAFGFGQPTGLGLRGEQSGVLRPAKRWGQIHLATHCYGYGLSVTPLQMARAMSVIANGGDLMRPRLVKRIVDARDQVVRRFPVVRQRTVLGTRATKAVTKGLEMVTHKGGTGRKARIAGYRVAGKTGTAYKVDRLLHGYNKNKVISSFVGFVPAQDPRLVIYVMVDEPKEAQYGGLVAGPIFSEIGREVLPYLGVEATESFDSVAVEDRGGNDAAEGLDPQARPWWYEEALLTGAPSHLVVPDVRGWSLADVVTKAADMKLEIRVEGAGLVIKQTPQPGALLPMNATLAVVLDLPGTPDSIGVKP